LDDGVSAGLPSDEPRRAWVSLVHDWYEPGHRDPQTAWVVEWLEEEDVGPTMRRAAVELGGVSAEGEARRAELLLKAEAVVAQGKPMEPSPFGFAATGFETRAELFERVKLTIYALDTASGRVDEAARRAEDFAATSLSVALTEMLARLRGLDELIAYVWKQAVTPAVRQRASQATDECVARLTSPPAELTEAAAQRSHTGEPHSGWTLALVPTGQYLQRGELHGLRWLAGKLLHYGPLPVAELRHWRMGAEPRWKWRAADAILPPTKKEQRPTQRDSYERYLCGRDIVGTVLMADVLIEIEHLFGRLLRESDEEERLDSEGR
jgi:hypothetical protein